ncbi:MAG: Z1 domain-containing protein, partial [Candidatus Pacebacteria bacterium]|nr:Z1 domain-containing protein [Candidatus Paceibacterota bacterium]
MPQTDRSVIRDGRHAVEVINVLSGEIENPEPIVSKATVILERSVDPIAGPPQSSDGLLYGLIQSGKTSIITVASAMAADNGFKCILILTSDIDLLYDQTLERVKKALRGLLVMGKNDWKDAVRFERHLRTSNPFAIVCSKNGSKLNSLLEAFKSARAKGLSALIVDDEADQASLNTFTSKGGEQMSRINEVITALRDFFGVNTYLQVTATPQALFLQRPDNRYRPSFTVLSEPGPGYVGGDMFFGDESRLLRFVPEEEVDELKSTHQPAPTGTVPKGMRQALNLFLVAATAKVMADPREGSAFLCHVSVNKIDHGHIVGLIDRYKEDTMNALLEPKSSSYKQLLRELEEAYKDLSETQADLPSLDTVIENIKFYLPGANVKLINAETNDEIKLDAIYNIFVGGNKLGRGVTIKNLLVSYYGRNPKKPNADTVLQHARMYGYRHNTIGLTRLFLPEKLANHFRIIHQMEEALRDLVQKFPEGRFQGVYLQSPLQATRRNVLDPNSIGLYVAGGSYNPSWPLRSPETRPITEWIDGKLAAFSDDG